MAALSVSVVIPNYNYGRYLEATVRSALAQTYPPLEVIVVDNGSTDDSRTVLATINDSRVRKIFQDNQGQSGARNSGLRLVTGDLVAFLDADDIWLPEKLARQIALLTRPEVGLVYCGMRVVDGNLQSLGVPDIQPKARGRVLDRFASSVAATVCGGESTSIVRASLLREAGEFDPRLSIAGGWDMWRRIASRTEIDFVPDSLVLYRQHGSNLSRRLDVYAHDSELKLAKMFADPESRHVWDLRGRAYGLHRMALAGAFFQSGQPLQAIRWALRAAAAHPASLVSALAFPWRRLRRFFAKGQH